MALLSKTKFEPAPEGETAASASAPVAPVETPVTAIAVAAPRKTAVAIANPAGRLPIVLESLKDALVVEFGTLPSLQVNQGNYIVKSSNTMLGDEVTFQLLSYQDQWVIGSSQKGDAALKALRYSADGITTTQGEDCRNYLEQMKQDFDDAKMTKRVILVLNLLTSSKKGTEQFCNTLYQVDLSKTSKSAFDSYLIQTAFKASTGKTDFEQASILRSSVEVKVKGDTTWSQASFVQA
jgi:hypothetical protein